MYQQKLEPGIYTLRVVNWKDPSVQGDFTLTSYSTLTEVKLMHSSDFLSEEIITTSPLKVDTFRNKITGVEGRSYLNKKSKWLSVTIEKPE